MSRKREARDVEEMLRFAEEVGRRVRAAQGDVSDIALGQLGRAPDALDAAPFSPEAKERILAEAARHIRLNRAHAPPRPPETRDEEIISRLD
jgi:hypothetical protein